MKAMETVALPARYRQATLVDLLDRVLDKGLVIQADLIISLAGVPLIGVNLRAALAGMETMLSYGLMQDEDERSREGQRRNIKEREPILLPSEEGVAAAIAEKAKARGLSLNDNPVIPPSDPTEPQLPVEEEVRARGPALVASRLWKE